MDKYEEKKKTSVYYTYIKVHDGDDGQQIILAPEKYKKDEKKTVKLK